LKKAADASNPDAQYRLAHSLLTEPADPGDRVLAAHYLKMAAGQHHIDAMYQHGRLLLDTDNANVRQSGEEILNRQMRGIEYLQNTSDNGPRDAQLQIDSRLHLEGSDRSLALHDLKMSADQGNVPGMLTYGLALVKGDGIPKDMTQGRYYLKKAADASNPHAQFNFGYSLLMEPAGPADPVLAAHYLKLAANQQLAQACLVYSSMLYCGKCVSRDIDQSFEYAQRPANFGEIFGQALVTLHLFA
jgi:TPR repeat protein